MRKEILGFVLATLVTMGLWSIVEADDVSITTTVSGYLTATFNYASIPYGSQSAGASNVAAPSQETGVYNVTVSSNQNYKASASGTNFTDGTHTFGINNLKMDTNSTAGDLAVGNAITLSDASQDIDTYPYTATANFHGFWLSIPASQFAAAYTSTVSITYSAV